MTLHWILVGVGVRAVTSGIAGLASLYCTGTPLRQPGEDLGRLELDGWALAYLAWIVTGACQILIIGVLAGVVPGRILL